MKVAILQPHFLPYIGHFKMMDMVDKWVFYDDVQFEKQSWQTRNKLLINGEARWISVPVESHLGDKINEVKIKGHPWEKIWKTVSESYCHAPYFEPYYEIVMDMILSEWTFLCDKNIYLERMMCELLNVDMPEFILSSTLDLKGSKTDRVLDCLHKLNATEYISGQAAKDYIEEDKFDLKLTWFEFEHPVYPNMKQSYLSALDLLFNTGEDAINYIRGNNGSNGNHPRKEGE